MRARFGQFTCNNIVAAFLQGVLAGNDGSEADRVGSNQIPAQRGADVVYIDVVFQAESLAGRLNIFKRTHWPARRYPGFDFSSVLPHGHYIHSQFSVTTISSPSLYHTSSQPKTTNSLTD